MATLLILEIVTAVICLAIGLFAGYWFGKEGGAVRSNALDDRAQLVGEALDRLREISSTIRSDVGQHSSQVREVNDELDLARDVTEDAHIRDNAMVAVAKLIASNQRMQQRLATNEEKLRQQSEELDEHIEISRTDALTGLANRHAFDEEIDRRLAEWRRHESPMSLMILDIDRFKRINDNHGHVVGDKVLCRVADTLVEAMREIDIVARYGGEEMAVILPHTCWQEAALAAERARLAIEQIRVESPGEPLSVTVSIGLAEILPSDNALTLVRRADEALYASKHAGRNLTHRHDGDTSILVTRPPKDANAADGAQDDSQEEAPVESRWPETAYETGQTTAPPTTAREPMPVSSIAVNQTQFLNRHAFCDEVRQQLAHTAERDDDLTVLLIEIDRYDELEKQFGPSGTETIRKTVMQFVETATSPLDPIGCFDDHRIAVLLMRITTSEVAGVAERLRGAVASCHPQGLDDRCRFTIAAGLATAHGDDNLESLILRSETALAESQDAGGNRTSVHDGRQCRLLESVARRS